MASVQISAYYYLQKSYGGTTSKTAIKCGSITASNSSGTNTIAVNTLISYGNGTINWYNRTDIPAGWNFYQLTLATANCNVEASFYGPPLNEHYITGINRVVNHGGTYWTIWTFCPNQDGWAVAPVGADRILLKNGQTLAWAYEVPYQSPVPGTKQVGACS
jgi:hypothetical protein